MIQVTRLNNIPFLINSDLIELIEETPDTIVTLTTGKKFLVEESGSQILEKIIAFRQACFRDVLVRCQLDGKKGDQ